MLARLLAAALFLASTWGIAPHAQAQRQHTVRAGDSIARIARRYRVSVSDLALANRRQPGDVLRPGDVLTVPPDGVTYVRAGQTLSHVAHEHQCSVDELMRLNRLRRGRGLRAGQRLLLPGYQPPAEAVAQDWGTAAEPGLARIRRHDEVAEVQLLDAEGRVTAAGLEQLGAQMRRHDEDAAELPHPRLVRLLAAISDHFGGREITLVSGRREAGGYTRETSRHVSGHATDIRVSGVPQRVLWEYCRSLAGTGCGFYPRSTFVHVDVRETPAQWVDWSSPGRRAVYGNLRGAWRRACRRAPARSSSRCAREGRRITRPGDVPLAVELTEEARALMPVVPVLVAGEEPTEEISDDDEGSGES